jgi:hypothetical protein
MTLVRDLVGSLGKGMGGSVGSLDGIQVWFGFLEDMVVSPSN